jgi:trehalose 6-phosphate phosphatase
MTDLVGAFKARAAEAGILLDFDGTLSEIVELPSAARPFPGVADVLRRLVKTYGHVALVSGRAAGELVEWLGPDLDIWGVHGAERSEAGSGDVVLSPVALPFAETMRVVREQAEQRIQELDIPGAVVEDKRVMVALHFRAASDPDSARTRLDQLADSLVAEHRLWKAEGRMAFELRPPVEISKGDVVEALAREADLSAILFAGDDTVDLPGFDALDRLRQEKDVLGVRVGVLSAEAPVELVERADVTVEGPRGMLELLERLL